MRLAMITLFASSLPLLAAPVPKGKPSLYHAVKVGDKLVYEINDGNAVSERTDRVTAVEEKDGAAVVAIILDVKMNASSAPHTISLRKFTPGK